MLLILESCDHVIVTILCNNVNEQLLPKELE